MTVYTADAVALLRYLVDQLPARADELFTRAERGIDSIETHDVAMAEVLTAIGGGREVAGITLEMTPQEGLRDLVTNGPLEVATIGEHELAAYASELDRYSMHDGLIVATGSTAPTRSSRRTRRSRTPVSRPSGSRRGWRSFSRRLSDADRRRADELYDELDAGIAGLIDGGD